MEELIANLTVSPETDCGGDQHPHFADYKNVGKVAEKQRQRRREHLETRSRAREDWLDRRRNIEASSSSTTSEGTFPNKQQQQNAFALRRHQHQKQRAAKNPFKDCLMQSDWLVDIPEAQELSQWTLLPSPKGRRCLVVAQKRRTSVYYKNGDHALSFESPLPGGNSKLQNSFSLTILDCIASGTQQRRIISEASKFYVLDLLCWNKQMYTDHEFEFRQFFLRSKLDELKMEDGDGKVDQFVPLPSCPGLPEQIAEFMCTDFPYELDGLLFYFNSAHYIPGQTPLVGWLKPWMLPELLGVPVPERYYAQKESPSLNSKQFIDQYNEKHGHVSSTERNAQKAANNNKKKKGKQIKDIMDGVEENSEELQQQQQTTSVDDSAEQMGVL